VTVSFQRSAPAAPIARGMIWRVPLAAVVLVGTIWVSGVGVGPVPPLGPLLDPMTGVWSMPSAAELPRAVEAEVPGLAAPVSILYDDRAVPHVFATRELDAYRALGFVVARDRLFQLEIQTLAGSGRLTELAGPPALGLDREMRRLGLPRAAEQKLAALGANSPERQAMSAFADGVNAYIDEMHPADLPLEYRLLGRRPARWEPINTLHLLNRMGWTLAFDDDDMGRVATRARVGRAAADALFPVRSPIQEPVQPNGRSAPRFDFTPIPAPGAPDIAAASELALLRELMPARAAGAVVGRGGDAIGSNNWAVAPSRTAAGAALLAGDPHLELTLPSIWYEVQLTVPATIDVYGVTIPGAPAVVIGFNRDIAWTFTNTQADVLDFFEESVDDPARPARYRVDGAWRPIDVRIERYKGRRGETVGTDTVRYTHRGPMRRAGDRWFSMRWTVLDDSNVAAVFTGIAKAKSVEEFRRVTEAYVAPAQNMLVADRAGHIAIRSTGTFPIRAGDGRGDAIRTGDRAANDWQGKWPVARYPGAVDPPQGFLASANQQPIDPNVDPGYLGNNWMAPWRAMHINELLRKGPAATPDILRRYQTDPGSARADFFVPVLLRAAAQRATRAACVRAATLIGEWDRRYTRENRRAVLFEAAMRAVPRRLWDELRPNDGRGGELPAEQIVAELTADSGSVWWDDRRTPAIEHRDDILCDAMEQGLEETIRERGQPEDVRWTWDHVRFANIRHLLRLPALSALDIPMQGGPSTLNPSSGTGAYGASWRMVAEMGPEVRAWGTYPGGQSGNPISSRYLDRLPMWKAGTLDTLRFPRRPEDLAGTRVRSWLTLVPPRR
jgi:penicillin amidase